MKNKQVIRLTESDLHNMISEAVKVALNELDPRTYASYAAKMEKKAKDAAERGDYNERNKYSYKASEGYLAATDAWERDFGGENGSMSSAKYHPYYRNKVTGAESYYDPYTDTMEHDELTKGGVEKRRIRNYSKKKDSKEGLGTRVAREMATGTGTYIKGKGWQ